MPPCGHFSYYMQYFLLRKVVFNFAGGEECHHTPSEHSPL